MKWMIASDLHGSYYYAQQLQQAFERAQADRLLFLGALLYHGARNGLPREYAPKEVIPLLNGKKEKLRCVRGNCDAEVDQMVLNFPVLADYAVLPVGQRLVYVTHGHVFNLNHLPPLAPGDILLHGHTHAPAWTNFAQGSLPEPRLCKPAQGKHRPQLHDPGGKHRLLEDHGGRVLPPAAVVIML